MRPPRTVGDFELGSPLGIPNDAGFQHRVAKVALDLLERTDGPLIADCPEHVDEPADFTGWACLIGHAPASVQSLSAKIDRLATWYNRTVEGQGRTTVGMSGLGMASAGALVTEALDGAVPTAQALKEALDDLRAYYLEAAPAFPIRAPRPRARNGSGRRRGLPKRRSPCSPSPRRATTNSTGFSPT